MRSKRRTRRLAARAPNDGTRTHAGQQHRRLPDRAPCRRLTRPFRPVQARAAERPATPAVSASSGSESVAESPADAFLEAPHDAELYSRALEAAAEAAEDAAAFGSDGGATSVMLERRLGAGPSMPPVPRLSLRHAAAAHATLAGPSSPAFRDAPPELRSLPSQPSTLDAGAPGSAARLTQAEALVWSAASAIAAQRRRADDEGMPEAGLNGHGGGDAYFHTAPADAPRDFGAARAPPRDAYAQGFEAGQIKAAADVAARQFAAGLQPLGANRPR
jgi:hypothetical protein